MGEKVYLFILAPNKLKPPILITTFLTTKVVCKIFNVCIPSTVI